MECSVSESLPDRTWCILTYSGSALDIMINYVCLLFSLLSCTILARLSVKRFASTTAWVAATVVSLVCVSIFQIVLCYFLGCAGISIIWCAMCGWLISERFHMKCRHTVDSLSSIWLEQCCAGVSLGIASSAFVYYAFAAESITTVAHVCAILLGIVISNINGRLRTSSSNGERVDYEALETDFSS